MKVSLATNVSALRTVRQLDLSTDRVADAAQRLSSGLRINKASDDAAGLAIADSLRSDARVYSQARRNVGEATSALSIADATLGELSLITLRLGELATQASNGALGAAQRLSLDREGKELTKEFNRIVQSASFNSLRLLAGDVRDLRVQHGYGVEMSTPISIGTTLRADGTFQSGGSLSSGSGPLAVQVADINRDGSADLVSADGWDEVMSVYLGRGDGSFEARQSVATGAYNSTLDLTDFNNDGSYDVVTADNINSTISVSLGNGDGTFGGFTTYATGSSPWEVEARDLNSDGNVDVVTADFADTTVTIWYGNGDGTLGNQTQLVSNGGLRALDVADFNGDTVLDIASSGQGGVFEIYLGNGNGTFQAASSFTNPGVAYSISSGDFNGDSYLDIVSGDNLSTQLNIYLGNGNGTFRNPVAYTTGDSSIFVAARDFNSDGQLDVVSFDRLSDTASVLTGNGDGTFSSATSYSVGALPYGGDVADINGDGAQDLISANRNDDTLSIYLGNRSVGFQSLLQNPLDLTTIVTARSSLTVVDSLRDTVTLMRGGVGVGLSRLQAVDSNLQTAGENFIRAESQIRDTDVAEASAQYLRMQIVQNAGAAVLAQASQQPRLVLKLLGVE